MSPAVAGSACGCGTDTGCWSSSVLGFGRREAIAQLADVTLTGARIFPASLPPQWHAHAPDRAGHLTGTGGLALSGAQKRRLCSAPPGLP
jgi:hypothetical protein